MKKKLWYAVKSGRKTGLFTSWDDCKLQVIGYPGASYKGFFTKEEAMEFLGDVTDKKVKALKDELRVAVYVDGSYIPTIPDTFSFGVVFIHHGTVETYAEKIIEKCLEFAKTEDGKIGNFWNIVFYSNILN